MANKALFRSNRGPSVKATNTRNRAGGRAYKMTDAETLCQYVVTGTFNNTYYASAGEHLSEVQALCDKVDPELLAKAAVYGHQEGKMKDVPSYIMAYLAANGHTDLLRRAWSYVITNVKMLLNFVQIIRSGVTGRRSFGSAVKRLIQEWITSRDGKRLMLASIGHSDPSLADVIKMVHPRAKDDEQNDTLAYILGKLKYQKGTRQWLDAKGVAWERTALPEDIVRFEKFKAGQVKTVPDLPFRALTNAGLETSHWEQIAQNMPWNTLRMNLNMLHRNGVFNNKRLTEELAAKIADPEQVRKWNAFPYQLMAAYWATSGDHAFPRKLSNALQDALEVACENVPSFGGPVAICPDLSGSMGSPVHGQRNGVGSAISCRDVAALTASAISRVNQDSVCVSWATNAQMVNYNPRDSVVTNCAAFQRVNVGWGTDASQPLKMLNARKWKGAAIILLTDMESWINQVDSSHYSGTGANREWAIFKKRNPGAKFIGVNLAAGSTTQIPNDKDVLNVGGFSDSLFKVAADFTRTGKGSAFVDAVNSVDL